MLINYTNKELDMMARLMRAEALSDGDLGMLMVGNVIVNRVIANCDVFKKLSTITKVINEKNAFTGIKSGLYQSSSTTKEKNLAKKCLKGEYFFPATHALWFYNPVKNTCKKTWYNMPCSGSYKSHCFYIPTQNMCTKIR